MDPRSYAEGLCQAEVVNPGPRPPSLTLNPESGSGSGSEPEDPYTTPTHEARSSWPA